MRENTTTINKDNSITRRLYTESTLLYHYASPSGILDDAGIRFRFTRFDCVNDKTESKVVYGRFFI